MTTTSLGGNQYSVTIDGITQTVDLDGLTVISNEDYDKLVDAGLDNDTFIAPMHSEGDVFWEEAAHTAANYNGFDVDAYIAENTTA